MCETKREKKFMTFALCLKTNQESIVTDKHVWLYLLKKASIGSVVFCNVWNSYSCSFVFLCMKYGIDPFRCIASPRVCSAYQTNSKRKYTEFQAHRCTCQPLFIVCNYCIISLILTLNPLPTSIPKSSCTTCWNDNIITLLNSCFLHPYHSATNYSQHGWQLKCGSARCSSRAGQGNKQQLLKVSGFQQLPGLSAAVKLPNKHIFCWSKFPQHCAPGRRAADQQSGNNHVRLCCSLWSEAPNHPHHCQCLLLACAYDMGTSIWTFIPQTDHLISRNMW